MKNYSILSYNRTGSTVVGQMLAGYFGKEYQAEITNMSTVLMRYDETGKDVNVPFSDNLPDGTYVKTYDVIDEEVKRIFNYNNPKPFEIGTYEYKQEVEKRKRLLEYNKNSDNKSIFKIQPQTYLTHFRDLEFLEDYDFIFCARRDIREQILSYLIAMKTKIFHIGFNNQVVDVPRITINRKNFEYCLEGLIITNKLFKYFKGRKQIDQIIFYEDWEDDTNKILPLLGFKNTPTKTFKKIKYTVGEKHKLVNNLQEVYDWIDNEEEFNYTYKL